MPLETGTRLGDYEITAPLGAGGMGEVYRAKDTKLGREVALKVLPAQVAQDPERLERFEREARALAALDHPHIAGIYGFEEAGELRALALELIEGESLADRLARGPLSPDEALAIADQIADALEAAHERGIVHRDLKPANVMLRTDGTVKVLDFGLAKAVGTGPAPADDSQSPTMTAAATRAGVVLGTAAYMSPEQAKGQEVGREADTWALAAVLFEMLAGRRAFAGESVTEILASVMRDDPDWEALPSEVPAHVRTVLEVCLQKEPRDRLRDVGAARLALSGSLRARLPPETLGRETTRSWRWAVPVALLALTAGAFLQRLVGSPDEPKGVDPSTYVFTPLVRTESTDEAPAFSPDGQTLAYTTRIRGVNQIFTRIVGGPAAAQITRLDERALNPSWSPDGTTIYFQQGTHVRAVAAGGGTPVDVLTNAELLGPVHPDGKTFVFLRDDRVWAGSKTGDARVVSLPGEVADLQAAKGIGFSPRGERWAVLYRESIYLFDYPAWTVEARISTPEVVEAHWMPDGNRLLLRGRGLTLLDLSTKRRREILRTPTPITTVSVSPDGERIAFTSSPFELHVLEVSIPDRQVRTLEAGGGVSWQPVWAPSGTSYLFATNRSGRWQIVHASRNEDFSRTLATSESRLPLVDAQWSPDGSRFSYSQQAASGTHVMIGNTATGNTEPLESSAVSTRFAYWSPDGRWILYMRTTNEGQQVVRKRPGSLDPPEVLATYPREGSDELVRRPAPGRRGGTGSCRRPGPEGCTSSRRTGPRNGR